MSLTARLLPASRTSALALGLLAVCATGACSRQAPSNRHEELSGIVEALQPETGRLTLRNTGTRPEPADDQKVSCLLTNDTEIYINDRVRSLDAIQVGDTIELFGYRDPNPRAERFIVRMAYIARNEAPPPEPDLSPRTAERTTQPKEN